MTVTDAGTGIADGTSTVNLTTTSGSGADATAEVVVSGGTVTAITPATAGTGYAVGDSVSASLPGADVVTTTGEIIALDPVFTGGTGTDLSDGSIDNIPTTTNGSGSGAEIRVNFSGGDAQAYILQVGGVDYEVGDEVYIDVADAGAISGSNMTFTVTQVAAPTTAPGPNVTITADVATIS